MIQAQALRGVYRAAENLEILGQVLHERAPERDQQSASGDRLTRQDD
jgi:hypothetical protein